MIRIIFSALILTLISVFPFTSEAADRTGKYSIGVEGGYAIPLVNFGSDYDRSFALGANGGYWLNKKILTSVGFLYHLHHYRIHFEGAHSVNIFSIIPQFKYFIFNGPITPTIGLGFGVFRYGFSDDDTDISAGFNVNGGIDWNISETISLGANIKFNSTFDFYHGYETFYLIIGAGVNYYL